MNIKNFLSHPDTKLWLKSVIIGSAILFGAYWAADIAMYGMPWNPDRPMYYCIEAGGGWDKATKTCSR